MKITKQKFYLHCIAFLFFTSFISGQTVQKIGTNSMTINPNAVLELESISKGLLLPRVPLTSTSSISPMSGTLVAGMTVYNTATTNDVTPGFYYYNGSLWVRIADSASIAAASITGILPIDHGGTGTDTATGTGNLVLAVSPTFTGEPVAPTASPGTSTTQLATTAFVAAAATASVVDAINDGVTATAPSQNAVFDALALKAPLESPALTGTPVAPTATLGTSTTQLATTAFVTAAITASTHIIAKIVDYTILVTDNTILFDISLAPSGLTVTLPDASSNPGKIYVIRKTDSSVNTLFFSVAIIYTGGNFTSLNYAKTIRIQSDGTIWNLID
jgi:hypothetical protein